LNQPSLLERHNHLMNGWGRDSEVYLHIGFGGRSPVNLRVVIDEGQKLSLPRCVSLCHGNVPSGLKEAAVRIGKVKRSMVSGLK